MIIEACEDAIVAWIRFFCCDISSIDDFRNSDALIVLSFQIFDEPCPYGSSVLSRELFDLLCSKLSEKSDIEIVPAQSAHIEKSELINYCKILYYYAGSRNAQIYISPILKLPESQQSVLMQIFEELSTGASKLQNPVINEMELLEEENKRMKKQIEQLEDDLLHSQQQLQQVNKDVEYRILQEGSRNDILEQKLRELQTELAESKQELSAFESMKREFENQQKQLRVLREENDTLSHQQEQGAKVLVQLENYKQAARDLQERCKDVEQLEKEISRLRDSEAENVQIRLELHDVQGKLDAMKRANEVLASKLTDAVNENEVLRAANMKSELEAGRLHQQLKENTAETNDGSLKRLHVDNPLIPLLKIDPQLQSQLQRLQEERDRLAERISVLEQNPDQQQRITDTIVIKQQLEVLERVIIGNNSIIELS